MCSTFTTCARASGGPAPDSDSALRRTEEHQGDCAGNSPDRRRRKAVTIPCPEEAAGADGGCRCLSALFRTDRKLTGLTGQLRHCCGPRVRKTRLRRDKRKLI